MPRRPDQRDSVLAVRGKIVAMWGSGKAKREIAQEVDLSVRQIQRWIARYRGMNAEDGLLKNLPRTGRRRRLTAGTTNEITKYINANSFSTATKIKEELSWEGVSNSTIIRALHTNGVYCRKPARKPELTAENAIARLNFARENINRN
ncbi:Transposase [Popillia japonica]|uniref:Transposase n=1 Tax=Popillia japonica TaxID=7064 RepID=A0AAW1KM13_POPJA